MVNAMVCVTVNVLEAWACGGDGGVLVGEVHQPRLVLDRVELEQHLLVKLDAPL